MRRLVYLAAAVVSYSIALILSLYFGLKGVILARRRRGI